MNPQIAYKVDANRFTRMDTAWATCAEDGWTGAIAWPTDLDNPPTEETAERVAVNVRAHLVDEHGWTTEDAATLLLNDPNLWTVGGDYMARVAGQ